MSTPELRQKWRNYFRECDRVRDEYDKLHRQECARITADWRENPIFTPRNKLPYPSYNPPSLAFPDELRGLT